MNFLAISKVVVKFIPYVVGAVHMVEAIANDKHGKEKQDAAIAGIGAMISTAEASFGKEIMDVPEFEVLLRKLIDDYVAIQNFYKNWNENRAKSL